MQIISQEFILVWQLSAAPFAAMYAVYTGIYLAGRQRQFPTEVSVRNIIAGFVIGIMWPFLPMYRSYIEPESVRVMIVGASGLTTLLLMGVRYWRRLPVRVR